jgi:hypothetical protein
MVCDRGVEKMQSPDSDTLVADPLGKFNNIIMPSFYSYIQIKLA